MLTKNLNHGISISSKLIRLMLIFYSAVILAKAIWWVTNSTNSDIYIDKTEITQFDNSIKYIINRRPFGIITEAKYPQEPPIVSRLKLTGVYLNTDKNSLAFFELNHKPLLVKIGQPIEGEVILKSVKNNSVTISDSSGDTIIKVANNSDNIISAQNTSINNKDSIYNDNYTQQTAQSLVNNNITNEELQERRRKLLEEYMSSTRQDKEGESRTTRDAAEQNK